MVTQHFALVRTLTVTENVILGAAGGLRLDLAAAQPQVRRRSRTATASPSTPRRDRAHLSVGQQQRVEILKALYHNARILILDEPTAVLMPQEVDQLFVNLRHLRRKACRSSSSATSCTR